MVTNEAGAAVERQATDTAAASDPGGRGVEAWITLRQAAALTSKSLATMRRWKREERFPRWRPGAGGEIEVPIADVVAAAANAGSPIEKLPGTDLEALAVRNRAERDLLVARQELAVLRARLEAETARSERAENEVTFLRGELRRRAA
jgi:hypothetical protein